MAQWKVTLDDGSVHIVEADNETEAGQKATMQAPVTASGLGKQALASLGTGTAYAFGLPGTLGDIGKRGIEAGEKKLYKMATGRELTTQPSADVQRKLRQGPLGVTDMNQPSTLSGANLSRRLNELTGGFTGRQPENMPEEFIRTPMEFLPTAAMFGGLSPRNLMGGGILPGIISEGTGQLARRYLPNERPSWMPDWVPDKETSARVIGALGSPALLSMGRKAVTPYTAAPGRVKAAEVLRKEGVTFTAGQKTGASRLQYKEANTGRLATDAQTKQAEEFTAAALRRIGVTAPRATEDVMISADTRIGNMFNRLAKRYNIQPTPQMSNDLGSARTWYNEHVGQSGRQPIVNDIINDIGNDIQQSGTITGRQYQAYVSRLRSHMTAGAAPELRMTLVKVRKALDDAMEASIAKANPDDLGAWRVARSNYRNYLAIQDTLLPGAGPGAAEGLISPHQLATAVLRYGGKRNYVQGKSDMAELAKAGKVLLQKLPNSGTPGHLRAMVSGTPLAIGGAGAGYQIGSMLGPWGAAAGTMIGAVAPAAISAATSGGLMSKYMQKILGNQILPRLPSRNAGGGLLNLLQQEEIARRTHQGGGSNAP